MSISDEDIALFREMTQEVRPLKQKGRTHHTPPKPAPQKLQQHDPTLPNHWYDDTLPSPLVEESVTAEEVLFYIKDHLPHTTLQKLKKGHYCSDIELDLHGLTVQQATDELLDFLTTAAARQLRCIRLIHGKGNRSEQQSPVLKSWINQWLRQRPEVLAFCSARQRDGGTGALYVLLKRSAQE